MAGKIIDAEKNLKIGNKLNSNMVKISSKSILSYQNGSTPNVENCKCTTDEGMPASGYSEEVSMSEEPFAESENLKSECLDLLRKKLISDLSLIVFSTDLQNKLTKMEPIEISKERQSIIQKLLTQISQLSDAEKLLLYLKLPSSTSSPFDPLRQPLNPLGNRQEIQQTIVWIKTHLEEDIEISIPKQDVYDQYLKYCENVSMKPLSTADFGKVMKQVYPGVRPRRLGTRGNSRYCYSGMRNTCKLPTPVLPQSTVERSVSNGNGGDGSSSLSADNNKSKRVDKAKRKWKSSGCRSDKVVADNRSFDKDPAYLFKNAKRLKSKDESESGDSKELEVKEEEIDLGEIKCEESSENSFGAFDIECGLDNEFGIYFNSAEKTNDDSPTRSGERSSGNESEDKQNDFQKMPFHCGDSDEKVVVEQNKGTAESGTVSEVNHFSSVNGDLTAKLPDSFVKANGVGRRNAVTDQRKTPKSRTRSTTSSKASKNFKKCYVPIQPKPVDAPLNVRFEQPIGIGQYSSEVKTESNGPTLCEESDSQEPEEEIVRYFKHLDENNMNANADGLVDQAVNNIENSSVQISGISQIISNSKNPAIDGGGDVLSQETQQICRSQSCFEVQRGVFNLAGKNESFYVPRSQSSVELPTSSEQAQHKAIDLESGLDGKKKISHLRILLEKSISSSKNPYYGLKNSSNTSPIGNPVLSDAQSQSQINNPVNQAVPNGPNFMLSNVKHADGNFLKLNGLKILNKGPGFVPQSPNTRTKYFSFTPISPGPQSPLKTPSTPSASPFVSPRNTPVPRSRQNSHNDHFVPPSERKSGSMRFDGSRSDFLNENVFSFSKALLGNDGNEGNKLPTYPQVYRPRSFSSTNFCRSKTRRNSTKLGGYDRGMDALPKNWVQTFRQTNFSFNPPFSIHHDSQSFVSNESLSNEVPDFLENSSKLLEGQAATIRSQSVPLNRMISESSWMPTEMSAVYGGGYFNSENSNPSLATASGKFSDLMSNSSTNSPKDLGTNMSSFATNGEITSLGSSSSNNEVFSGDASMVHLNDQYFSGNFQTGNEKNFANESFVEENVFSNKLGFNSTGTFDGAFTSDSDSVMADNIKSYLPDFEGLDNKGLVESTRNGEGVVGNAKKLFKNVLYEGGNDNLKDPVITSFKPVLMNDMSSSPGSPVLNFFGTKMNEDNQQLIEFFDFED